MSQAISTETVSISDLVRQKLREQFAAIIPDEALDAMLQSEVKKFFSEGPGDNWGNNRKPSEFSLIIREECRLYLLETLREALEKTFKEAFSAERSAELQELVAEKLAAMRFATEQKAIELMTNGMEYDIRTAVNNVLAEKGIYR